MNRFAIPGNLAPWLHDILGALTNTKVLFKVNQPDSSSTADGQESLPCVTSAPENPQSNKIWIWFEIALIGLIFVFWGGLPPDVNESHYLTKAKHFWNPNWCPNDLFLSSGFSHWAFYASTGWLTCFFSLETTAWIGRAFTSVLIAFAWVRLSRCFLWRPGGAFVAACLFLILNTRFNLAGEWVVGGFEAKGIAYGFVLLALESAIRGRWHLTWPFIGIASAFHVLVGGWTAVALLALWVFERTVRFDSSWSQIKTQAPSLLLGFMISMLGIVPPLLTDMGVEPTVSTQAHAIYVHERISHHLLFGRFPVTDVSKFVFILVVWGFLYKRTYKNRFAKRLNWFCIGTLFISFGGLFLSGIAESNQVSVEEGPSTWSFEIATSLLRFYWFRIADFAIPLSVSFLAVGLAHQLLETAHANLWRQRIAVGASTLIVLAFGICCFEKLNDLRPAADQRSLPGYISDTNRTQGTYRNWKRVCDWIKSHTPSDSVFITPARQQTFKWYAGRTEIACWKDIPQDSKSMVEWWARVNQLVKPQQRSPAGLLLFSDQQIRDIANHYQADYLVVQQSEWEAVKRDAATSILSFERVYPERVETRSTYVVLKLR